MNEYGISRTGEDENKISLLGADYDTFKGLYLRRFPNSNGEDVFFREDKFNLKPLLKRINIIADIIGIDRVGGLARFRQEDVAELTEQLQEEYDAIPDKLKSADDFETRFLSYALNEIKQGNIPLDKKNFAKYTNLQMIRDRCESGLRRKNVSNYFPPGIQGVNPNEGEDITVSEQAKKRT